MIKVEKLCVKRDLECFYKGQYTKGALAQTVVATLNEYSQCRFIGYSSNEQGKLNLFYQIMQNTGLRPYVCVCVVGGLSV